MVRLVFLVLLVIFCSPALALDCPAGTTRIQDRCVPFGSQSGPVFPDPGIKRQPEATPAPYSLIPAERDSGTKAPHHSYDFGDSFVLRSFDNSPSIGAKPLVPVRAYLGVGDIPPPGIGAYGIVVLRARPTGADRARLRMMCGAFTAIMAKQSQLPASIAIDEQMLTVWPLDSPQDPRAQNDDCDYVLDTYALFAGDQAVADATKQGYSFSGQGPYLVGWSPSNTRGVRDRLALVVDMSGFDSQNSFNNAFLFWKQKVVEDPALWRSGFSVERFRLSLHDFADHYGQAFLDAIKLVSAK